MSLLLVPALAVGAGAYAHLALGWPGGRSPGSSSGTIVQAADVGPGAAVSGTTAPVQTVEGRPVADTYVVASRPTANRGDRAWLYATTSENRAFLRFDTKPMIPAGKQVVGASLRVYVLKVAVAEAGLEVHPLANDWQEAAVTARTRPAYQAKAVSRQVAVPGARQWVTVPLSPEAISTTTETSIELLHRVHNAQLQLASRESANPPVLQVQVATSATTTATTTTTTTTTQRTIQQAAGVRPFDMPSTSTLQSSKRLVFAHYFTPFPRSHDNKPASADYYARELIPPDGENGKHRAYGGLMRDRPLGRSALSGDFVAKDLEAEVSQAIAAGLDGFNVDILSLTSRNWDRCIELLEAAHRVDPDFKIMLMPDMTTLDDDSSAALASAMARLAKYPAAFKLADGRLVISPFKAEAKSASWWKSWLATMKNTHNTPVAFVPTFLDWQQYADDYAGISYGFSHWATAHPDSASRTAKHAAKAKAMGKLWMAPVRIQDVRPNQGIYDEAGATETLRDGWTGVIASDADWVQIPTWNDYSEGTSISPSQSHRWAYLDISSYYLARWKTGSRPAVKRDGLYLVHRTQTYNAAPSFAQTKVMKIRSGAVSPRNQVEALVFLTKPATVTVTVGSATHTWDAPAGMSRKVFPLATGSVSGKVVRNGAVTTQVTSPHRVTSRPYVQDLEYHAVSSLR